MVTHPSTNHHLLCVQCVQVCVFVLLCRVFIMAAHLYIGNKAVFHPCSPLTLQATSIPPMPRRPFQVPLCWRLYRIDSRIEIVNVLNICDVERGWGITIRWTHSEFSMQFPFLCRILCQAFVAPWCVNAIVPWYPDTIVWSRPHSRAAVTFPADWDHLRLAPVRRRALKNPAGGGAEHFRRRQIRCKSLSHVPWDDN